MRIVTYSIGLSSRQFRSSGAGFLFGIRFYKHFAPLERDLGLGAGFLLLFVITDVPLLWSGISFCCLLLQNFAPLERDFSFGVRCYKHIAPLERVSLLFVATNISLLRSEIFFSLRCYKHFAPLEQ